MSGKGWGQTAIVSNSGTICAGADVTLFETGGDAVSWLWSTNGSATFSSTTEQNPIASGAVNGESFTVVITDINSNTASATTIVMVNALPVVTFITQPGASTCIGVNVTYSTQASMSNYVWSFPGTIPPDYTILSGGDATSNTVTVKYLTAGIRTVNINYKTTSGCSAVLATSSTATTINPLPTTSAIYHQ